MDHRTPSLRRLVLSRLHNDYCGLTAAFTLIELLAIIGIAGILTAILLPALSGAKGRAKGTMCLNNTKQLMLALHSYASDSAEYLPPNPDDGKIIASHHWCSGQAGKSGNEEFNTEILKDRAYAMLNDYIGGRVSIYRCPSDRRIGRSTNRTESGQTNNQIVPAARSISMNQAIGTDPTSEIPIAVNGFWLDGEYKNTRAGPYQTFARLSDFTKLGPANAWCLIDESDYNLNDAAFAVAMDGDFWLDFPGTYHNKSSGLAFVDGHSEFHQWRQPHVAGGQQNTSPNIDWIWLRDRTSTSK